MADYHHPHKLNLVLITQDLLCLQIEYNGPANLPRALQRTVVCTVQHQIGFFADRELGCNSGVFRIGTGTCAACPPRCRLRQLVLLLRFTVQGNTNTSTALVSRTGCAYYQDLLMYAPTTPKETTEHRRILLWIVLLSVGVVVAACITINIIGR